MKTIKQNYTRILTIIVFTFATLPLLAPIGSGVAILLALGAAYGGKKVYDFRKHKLTE